MGVALGYAADDETWLSESDADGFGALAALGDVNHHPLALVEAHQPRALQRRGVHKHVLAAAVAHDKAKPLRRVVPLHRPLLLRGRLQRRLVIPTATAATHPRAARTRTSRRRRRAVDGEHLGHLRAALTRRHPNLQGLARLDLLHPDPTQHARVQKRVAPAIRKLDKAKPAVAAKPLHHRLHRRARRLLLKARTRAIA